MKRFRWKRPGISLFAKSRTGKKMSGVEKPYRDESVIWYTNRLISCGPRVSQIKCGLMKKRSAKMRSRYVNHPFSNKYPF